MIEYNKLDNWKLGFIISSQSEGSVVPLDVQSSDAWSHLIYPVSKGDKVYVSSRGGTSPRAIAILDDEYKLIFHSNAGEQVKKIYDIEQDGFILLNNYSYAFNAEVLHYPFSQDNTDLGRVYTTHNHGEDTTEEYQVTIGENIYPAVKIGNQLWTAKNLAENLGTLGEDEWYYSGRSIATKVVEYYSGNMTIRADSIYDNLAYFWDWETGVRATTTTKVKSKLTKGLSLNCTLTFSEPLKSDQIVYYHVARIIDDAVSYISNVKTIPAGTKTYIYNYKFSPSSIDYDVRHIIFRLGANTTNDGITCAWSNINISYSYVDNVVTNITLPQALANEETAKANNDGRLYDWNNINNNLSKLNLKGWRWPTDKDYDTLVAIDPTGTKFRSKNFANGTDDFGFNDIGSGRYSPAVTPVFAGIEQSLVWTSTSLNVNDAQFWRNYLPEATIQTGSKYTGRALRLVLDIPEDGSLPDGTVRLEKTNQARNIGKGYIQDNNYQPGDFNVNEQISLLGKYGVTKIGNQLWTTENLDEELGTLGVDEWYYNGRSNETRLNDKTEINLPTGTSGDLRFYFAVDTDDEKAEVTKFINGKTLYITGKCSINIAQTTDTISSIYYSYRIPGTETTQYLNLGQFVIPAGQTEGTINMSRALPNNATTTTGLFIRVGNNVTAKSYWFYATNLSVGVSSSVKPTNISFKQALENEESAKSNHYGRLYNWSNLNNKISKLGLSGWRVPTKDDSEKFFEIDSTLAQFFRKSSGGSDAYGFGLFGAGVYSGTYFSGPPIGRYWSSSKYDNNSAYRFLAFDSLSRIYRESNGALYQGASIRLVLDLNPDGSYPENATPLKLRETYKPYNRNIGTGAKPYIPNDDGKVYVDDVRCDIVCPHDKPETSETNSISLASETVSEPIIEE